jgi:Fe-S-cluster containining protein
MSDRDAAGTQDLPAGDFASWVIGMQRAIRSRGGSDVPCAGCTACCTSSRFVHIEPDETETLARIPAALRFPAPGRPRGHVVLGYDERGHCPMLIEGRCSIYEHRPRTCRTYDCRVFAASGSAPDDDIGRRARRWRFDLPTEEDGARRGAVRAAARFLREHRDLLPDGVAPTSATEHAVLAVVLHDAFLQRDEVTGRTMLVEPDRGVIRTELLRRVGARLGPEER